MVADAGDDRVEIGCRVAKDECVVDVDDDVCCFCCSSAIEWAVVEG